MHREPGSVNQTDAENEVGSWLPVSMWGLSSDLALCEPSRPQCASPPGHIGGFYIPNCEECKGFADGQLKHRHI